MNLIKPDLVEPKHIKYYSNKFKQNEIMLKINEYHKQIPNKNNMLQLTTNNSVDNKNISCDAFISKYNIPNNTPTTILEPTCKSDVKVEKDIIKNSIIEMPKENNYISENLDIIRIYIWECIKNNYGFILLSTSIIILLSIRYYEVKIRKKKINTILSQIQ